MAWGLGWAQRGCAGGGVRCQFLSDLLRTRGCTLRRPEEVSSDRAKKPKDARELDQQQHQDRLTQHQRYDRANALATPQEAATHPLPPLRCGTYLLIFDIHHDSHVPLEYGLKLVLERFLCGEMGMARGAAYYREEAAKLRALAPSTNDPIIRQQLLDLIAEYEELAKLAEQRQGGGGPQSGSD